MAVSGAVISVIKAERIAPLLTVFTHAASAVGFSCHPVAYFQIKHAGTHLNNNAGPLMSDDKGILLRAIVVRLPF